MKNGKPTTIGDLIREQLLRQKGDGYVPAEPVSTEEQDIRDLDERQMEIDREIHDDT